MRNAYDFHTVDKTIADLDGDDFELFNRILIYKSGYVVLESSKEIDSKGYAKKVLSNLSHCIDNLEPDYWTKCEGETRDYPVLVGGISWDNRLTEEFAYLSVSGLEVHVQTVRKFCEENENRKYFGLVPIPFIKDMDSNNAFHVTFIDFMRDMTADERMKQCNQAVKELMGYLNSTRIPTREYDIETGSYKSLSVKSLKWVNTPLRTVLFDN